MAATVRKQQKGASPSTNNRRSAWRGGPPHFTNQGHASRSHGPPIPTPGQGFPPMNQVNAPSLSLQQSLGLALNTNIVVFIRNGSRHAGTLVSIESTGFTLKHSKELSRPNSAPQDSMFFPAEQLVNWHPGESPSGHAKGFRTDSDISQNARSPRERPLQAWTADPNHVPPLQPPMPNGSALQNPDDATFGPNANTGQPWDQFVANQQLFGVTATFNEEMYTTPLDRNAPDFKEREARAIKIANEIQSSASNNPHIAEERNLLDDSGANEEDKYGAVVRAPGAYVPPGARAAAAAQPSPSIRTSSDRSAAPTVTSSNATNATAGSVGNESGDNKLVGAFRDFVDSERQRFVQKKQQIVKKEKDNRIADLLKFSQEFKLNRPIPPDLLPILSKDEKKQHEIAERSKSEASSTSARAIGATAAHSGVDHSPQVPPRPIAALPPQGKADASLVKRPLATSGATPVPPRLPVTPANPKPIVPSTVTPSGPATSTSRGSTMVIQKIPPYRKKPDQSPPGTTASPANLSDSGAPASPTNSNASGSNAFKFNAKASSFRPNPNASAFKPVVTSPTPAASTSNAKSVKVEQTVPPNPFFGARPVNKKPIHIKEDFNPFKFAQVAEAPVTTPQWPYSGKRYMAMFPTIHSPNHAPSVPGPPFEEDPAAAAARGYGMMYYAPYPYQGQHPQQQMMTVPGTAAPPPGYMPSPFMQPLPYPPPPHQPNGPPAMYGPPPLNGMQAHGYPPPPGPYPPNGAPRGSMPPTPIQQPAYAYHQSPQMSHAVPYPMMMSQPPPPGGAAPPLPYDQSGPPGGPGSGPPPMNMGH
ncbi:uncharacterized protein EI90DRAFT_3150765 [Cantharellus anzutake]|uniref:uncharacterized protein n=1 Tax=Cantharellus anzutake TaxID=1750568 RepID=UPI001906A447|nr:uncharacterized protein EI90DRAFT_3150765 [Cantharellus anzutake]KAF8340359.1 hypothetical protein EI90DRAFT_3150765 [Cantharellus anzutake]